MLEKLVSGGQAGADLAALDAALRHGLPHGGWCPRGRTNEDGRIPDRFRLTETPGSRVAQRTEWNVRDSDGTVVFTLASEPTGGSRLTVDLATQLGKPCLHLTPAEDDPEDTLASFLAGHEIRVLNVAGSRASEEPGVGEWVARVLDALLSRRPRD